MFGRQSGLNSSGNSSNLVEFRAGRMNMIGKMVHPDARKGLVYMTQSDDGLMHFCWKDRGTGRVEDDLIVFPDDFEFKRVEQCKTGRVYVLKFKTSSRRMFFWMQEPKTDKDEEFCRRVNELLNNPPSAQRGGSSDNNDLQYMLNNMSQQQLMQLFGGVGQMGGLSSLLGSMNRNSDSSRTPSSSRSGGFSSTLLTPENSSTTVPRTPAAPKAKSTKSASGSNSSNGGTNNGGNNSENGGKNPINSTELQSYLSNLSPEAGASRSLNIDLSTTIAGSDAVNQLITDPEAAKTLCVHLPELDDNDETRKQQIKEHIQSPQFQQALTMFTGALQSAQLGPVVSQFELPADAIAAAYAGNLEDFVKALENALPEGATMNVDTAMETNADTPTGTKDKDTPKSEADAAKTDDKKTEE